MLFSQDKDNSTVALDKDIYVNKIINQNLH